MESNFDFKYTEREYEVMLLKKELKNQMKGAPQQQDQADVEDRQEMNELVDSDFEVYGGDTEEMHLSSKTKKNQKERDKLKADIQGQLNKAEENIPGVMSNSAANDQVILKNLFDPEEISLIDPEEEREIMKNAKELQSKIHNSFTGPYPLDPTEFSHTDKGENYQFSTLTEKLDKYWVAGVETTRHLWVVDSKEAQALFKYTTLTSNYKPKVYSFIIDTENHFLVYNRL